MHYITHAEYIGGYQLRLTFEDQEQKLVDLKPYLEGGVFEPLKNLEYFKLVRLNPDIDTIVWPNNADFSPDFLYEIGKTCTEHAA
jgi:hypothetical protein